MDELQSQLDQLHSALALTDEESKPGIQQLIHDIQELLSQFGGGGGGGLSSSSLLADHQSLQSPPPVQSSSVEIRSEVANGATNEEDDEFLKFQAEIAALESTNQSSSSNGGCSKETENFNSGKPSLSNSVQSDNEENQNGEDDGARSEDTEKIDVGDEFKALEGMKCLAPFEHHWGQIGYYSSIILGVEGESSSTEKGVISVRVVFTQPVVERMKPCEFFMEGRCRFLDNECKFSHGEMVSLSDLREYEDPDYSKIVPGANILAKYSDGLWYKAVVRKLTENGECEIVYHSYKDQTSTVPIHETCPLTDSTEGSSSSSGDSSSDEQYDNSSPELVEDTENPPVVIIRVSADSPLGEWEKHTKGIGSKLMAKMGYIIGTGLGKHAEGRVNPVDAVVLPPGRSLDKCMELKEKAGSSGENLFSVERRLKRQKHKQAMRAKTEEKKQKQTESVFNFLNSNLNLKKPKHHGKANGLVNNNVNYNKETCKDLSKNLLTIGASIKLVEKEISKCKEGIKRHEGRDKTTVDRLKDKLNVLEHQLTQFKNNEEKIAKEQNSRTAKKKLALF